MDLGGEGRTCFSARSQILAELNFLWLYVKRVLDTFTRVRHSSSPSFKRETMVGSNIIKAIKFNFILKSIWLMHEESPAALEKGIGRKLAAIMFTDIVGYTALKQSDEALALDTLRRHNQLLRPFFPRYNGREVKTIGDSFLVEFGSALNASLCAIEIQKFLHNYNNSIPSNNWKIKLRIGIHLGDVVTEDHDIFGDAVNIASRIQPLANPEGICVSQQVFDQIHNKIGYPIKKLQFSELKNVEFQTNVYSIVMTWQTGLIGNRSDASSGEFLDRRRIAVLPFSNISPDPRDEYFSDGMTDEMISVLSKIKGVRVVARTSAMRFKGEKVSVRKIAEELKVGSLVEGSVRKSGNRARISVQLVDPKR
jgi:adenylate cyclase